MSQSSFRGVVSLSLLLSLGCSAMQITRDESGFRVMDQGQQRVVRSYDVDPILRKMNSEQLRKFLAAGCKIRANKCSNGDYVLRAFVPGKGGGLGDLARAAGAAVIPMGGSVLGAAARNLLIAATASATHLAMPVVELIATLIFPPVVS
jgi:hypothetical protein